MRTLQISLLVAAVGAVVILLRLFGDVASFAPVRNPRLAVAVVLVDADADGGTVAAPVAHDVLATGLLG